MRPSTQVGGHDEASRNFANADNILVLHYVYYIFLSGTPVNFPKKSALIHSKFKEILFICSLTTGLRIFGNVFQKVVFEA